MKRLAALLVLLAACNPSAQSAAQAPAQRFPPPDRPVAEIVSPIFSSEEARDAIREPQQVFRALGIKPGMAVADIGAGSGYYVVRLAREVGPTGKVYGQDVDARYLADLKRRVDQRNLSNVTLVLGQPDDPKLPPASLDAVLMIHMYHEIAQPYGLLHRLAGVMKPGGRLAILDANRQPQNHGTPPALLRCELAAVGYKQILFRPVEGDDEAYIAVFAPPAAPDLPAPEAIKPCKD